MAGQGRELPTGTVTFLFTDVEGSTHLLRELGAEGYGRELLAHHDIVRNALAAHDGVEVGTEGDAFFIAFRDASAAVAAAADIQRSLRSSDVRVRIGVHTGVGVVHQGEYVGLDVHKAARIGAAAHGGQTVVSAATRELMGADLRDLGEHRLKDFPAPERLFQLGADDFPALRAAKVSNLPAMRTRLVGRDDELVELNALVGEHQLVTITGAGGTGKTTLAMALATAAAHRFTDGGWWVNLEAVSSPDVVLAAISDALGAPSTPFEHLARREALVVLDNFEHVVEAAPTIGHLLDAAPCLRVLVTSRERLGLDREQEYPLTPLRPEFAAELFQARARRVRPDFKVDAAVATICSKLDHLPLAVELAATRVKVLTTEQILSRLTSLDFLRAGGRGVAERRSTMRATIAWSYDLLADEEQRSFRALGVFPASFDIDAAEAVAQTDVDVLGSLIDKSLLRSVDDGRLTLLATTRDFAAELLDESSEAIDVRRRHAEWFIDRARSGDPRFSVEIENFRTTLSWTLENDLDAGFELAQMLARFASTHGGWGPLASWYEDAFARASAMEPEVHLVRLRARAAAAFHSESLDRAEQIGTAALELARRHGAEGHIGALLVQLGMARWAKGATSEAIGTYREALEIQERATDSGAVARTLHLLGEALRDAGETEEARAVLERAIEMKRDAGDQLSAMRSIHSLADLALDDRALAEAAAGYAESLSIAREVEDNFAIPYCLAGLACVAAVVGAIGLSGRLWAATEKAEEDGGVRMFSRERSRYEAALQPFIAREQFAGGRADPDDRSPEAILEELVPLLRS